MIREIMFIDKLRQAWGLVVKVLTFLRICRLRTIRDAYNLHGTVMARAST